MTTVYNSYYNAYDNGEIDLEDISLLVMLCDNTYIPLSSHYNLDDIVGTIISVPYIITKDDISKLTMSEIVEKTENAINDYAKTYPDEIREGYEYLFRDDLIYDYDNQVEFFLVFYYPKLQILCFAESVLKNKNLNV